MQGRLVESWNSMGIEVKTLDEVLCVVTDPIVPQDFPEEEFSLISVSYDGICRVAKKIKGKRIKPTEMYRVRKGDLFFQIFGQLMAL